MNVSDLTAALHEQADEMDELMTPQLPHVHARVDRARWRRGALVAGVVASAAAAAAVLVIVLPGGHARPEPAAPPPQPAAPEQIVFPQHIRGYHLVTMRIGAPGDPRIALHLPARSHRFTIKPLCRSAEPKLDTRLVVDGTNVGGVYCTRKAPPGPTDAGWSEHDLGGVRLADRPLVVSLTLLRMLTRFSEVPTTQPDTVLGLALYERDH
jgi:hypothetical protein